MAIYYYRQAQYFQILLDHPDIDFDVADPKGRKPIHIAALESASGNEHIYQNNNALLKLCRRLHGPWDGLNAKNSLNGKTALHCIAQRPDLPKTVETLKLLLEHGACPKEKDFQGNPPLFLAVTSEFNDFSQSDKWLDSIKARCSSQTPSWLVGGPVYLKPNQNSGLETIAELVRHGSDLDTFNAKGDSLVNHLFAESKYQLDAKALKFFVRLGMKLDHGNKVWPPTYFTLLTLIHSFLYDGKECPRLPRLGLESEIIST